MYGPENMWVPQPVCLRNGLKERERAAIKEERERERRFSVNMCKVSIVVSALFPLRCAEHTDICDTIKLLVYSC